MRRVFLLLPILMLLMASCELYYEEPVQRGTVRIVSIGITYENEPDEVADPEYEDKLDDLPGTVYDAREISDALKQQAMRAGWNSEDIEATLLLQEGTDHTQETFDAPPGYASRDRLENTLADIVGLAAEDDLTIITYSGHGGVEGTGELVMAHTQTSGEIDKSETSSIMVTPQWLHARIEPIKGKKLLILDSCYSGLFIPPESASSLSWVYDKGIDDWYGKYFSDEEYEIPSFMVLTASADSDSYERKFDDHSHGGSLPQLSLRLWVGTIQR